MNSHRIYLDNNATTALDPRVREAMIEELQMPVGNPSSVHAFGQETRNRVTRARRLIAQYLGVKPQELIFTSGGTEAINMVIKGFFTQPLGHIITSNIEHSAVYHCVKSMECLGCSATFLSPGLYGAVSPDAVVEAIKPNTKLIVLMAVNNETGVKTDIDAIAKIAHEKKIPFIVDGVALLGKEMFKIPEGVSAMCFSAHKLHGPSGIGLAIIRNKLKLLPLLVGGQQEYGRRGGSENVPGIIGFAEAIHLLDTVLPEASTRMEHLRDHLENGLKTSLPGISINGHGKRVVNTTNISFAGIDGESLLMKLDLAGIAVSHGSACSSGALEPSRILLNMGIPPEVANTSIRFSLSRFTTIEEIDLCIDRVVHAVKQLRALV